MEPRRVGLTRNPSYLDRPLPIPSPSNSTQSSSAILNGLNAAQKTAVTTPARVLQILAPPGSGKTRTLTSRVAYLLSVPQRLCPENVIVATFTVKAANEMKERLAALVGAGVEKRLLMGTFHSISRRYLIKYGYLIGLKKGWGIADSADSKAICQRVIKRRKLGDSIDAKQLLSRISHFKARNLSPRANTPIFHSTQTATQNAQKQEKDIANEEFIALYDDYHSTLEASNLLDYDDLLQRCLEVLKQYPECVSNIEAVLIDEFQDTNVVQYELMRSFAWKEKRITVVGDPDQSIYGFRAAEIENLRKMQRAYSDTLVVNLENNYRSSASILQAALEVIKQDKSRPDRPLTATHAVGPSPVLRRTPSPATEAEWIETEIRRLRAVSGGIIRLDGIAILVRSAPLTRQIETALARNGVAYKMVGGTRFFDRAEVRIVLDYMRVLQSPANNDALIRIINVPSRKVGDSTVKALLEVAESKKRTLWDHIHKGLRGDVAWGTLVSKQAEKGLGSLVSLIRNMVSKLDDEELGLTLAEVLECFLEKLEYSSYLERHYPEDFEGRWANVEEVIFQAREIIIDEDEDFLPGIEGIEQQDSSRAARLVLEHFLANAALVNERKQKEDDGAEGEVTISTIHAAKGLEWPVVFVPSVYEGSIPHSRADDTDEERRLLYVAMTRAKALLYLSCPFRSPNSSEKTKISSFLDIPSVSRLLEKRGSIMSFTTVQTIALILSVDCPPEKHIEAWIGRSNIQSRLDDRVTDQDPSEKDEQTKAGDRDFHGELPAPQFQSARKYGSGVVTTEDKIRQKLTTADKIGFRSASNHLSELQNQGDLSCEAEKIARQKRDLMDRAAASLTLRTSVTTAVVTKTSTTTVTKKSTTRTSTKTSKSSISTNQGTLMSFFMKKPPPPLTRQPSATETLKVISKTSLSLKDQMECLPEPVIPKREATDFVVFSSSPVQRTPKKPRIAYDNILPSSPPTAPCSPTPLKTEATVIPPISLAGKRRTLGIKRSMSGWENRKRR